MKNLFFLNILILSITSINAQVIDKKNIEKVAEPATLMIFGIMDDKKGKNENVSIVHQFSSLIKENWTYHNRVEIMGFNEARKFGSKNKIPRIQAEFINKKYEDAIGSTNKLYTYSDDVNELRIFFLKGKYSSLRPTLSIYLENDINESDIVYALTVSQFIIKNAAIFKEDKYVWRESSKLYGEQLTAKTLLLDKDKLNGLTEVDIRMNYPYKFEIVTKEDIDRAIINKEENKMIVYSGRALFTDGNSKPVKTIYSTADGAIVSWSVTKFSFGDINLGNKFSEKDLKRFIENAGLE